MTTQPKPLGLRMLLKFHAKLANGGFAYQYELVDFPGITVEMVKQSRNHPVEKAFYFEDMEFGNPGEAIAAWKKAKEVA